MHHPGRFFTMANLCECGEDVAEIYLENFPANWVIEVGTTIVATGETITWDWGDGTVVTGLTGAPPNHSYGTRGSWVIRIFGKIESILGDTQSTTPHGWIRLQNGNDNTYIRSVWLPKCVTEIRTRAFARCRGMTEFHAPGVKTVGDSAFDQCTSLREIDAPLVRSVSEWSFRGCTALRRLRMSGEVLIGGSSFESGGITNGELIANASTASIMANAFKGSGFKVVRFVGTPSFSFTADLGAFASSAITDLYLESMTAYSVQNLSGYYGWGLAHGTKIHCSNGNTITY